MLSENTFRSVTNFSSLPPSPPSSPRSPMLSPKVVIQKTHHEIRRASSSLQCCFVPGTNCKMVNTPDNYFGRSSGITSPSILVNSDITNSDTGNNTNMLPNGIKINSTAKDLTNNNNNKCVQQDNKQQ